jgi:hypothetical protein
MAIPQRVNTVLNRRRQTFLHAKPAIESVALISFVRLQENLGLT